MQHTIRTIIYGVYFFFFFSLRVAATYDLLLMIAFYQQTKIPIVFFYFKLGIEYSNPKYFIR